VIVLSRKSRSRARLRNIDRLIFVWLYRFFPSILNAITVVKPENVIRWHRRGLAQLSHSVIPNEVFGSDNITTMSGFEFSVSTGVGITLDTYSHVLPAMQKQAVLQLEASLRAARRGDI
jgi:hypothetical protein